MPRFIVIADDAQLFVAADLATAHTPVPKNSVVEGDFATAGGVWLNVRVVATPDGKFRGVTLDAPCPRPYGRLISRVDLLSVRTQPFDVLRV